MQLSNEIALRRTLDYIAHLVADTLKRMPDSRERDGINPQGTHGGDLVRIGRISQLICGEATVQCGVRPCLKRDCCQGELSTL